MVQSTLNRNILSAGTILFTFGLVPATTGTFQVSVYLFYLLSVYGINALGHYIQLIILPSL